ncbi:hypothetical protein [Ornithinimicrobium flavum]|uniref:hypothetical protein n=1 Tax=Ornithinimicrobium flavum TaxID=1288636 RepID=UPI00106FBEFC|nr:hypothetical protein [Ornithinimicrobium flavum]
MTKPFLEIRDVEDDDQLEPLADLAGLDSDDMGPVLASFRPWPSPRVWLVQLALSALFLLPWLLPGENSWALSATLLVCQWGTLLIFLLAGVVDRHRVCEHGLVLGLRRRSTLVVPWSTLDPGRVRIVERSSLLGRYDRVPATGPHFRQGFLTTRSLAVNGLDTAPFGALHLPHLYSSTDVADVHGTRATPFVWWLMGSPQPERIARAIEEAMIADGYDAAGLAERAVANSVQLRWNPDQSLDPLPPRAATDPVLGARGPLLPRIEG